MIERRRTFLQLAGLATLIGTPAAQTLADTVDLGDEQTKKLLAQHTSHPLFATKRITGVEWKQLVDSVKYHITEEAILSEGVDLLAEMQDVIRRETIFDFEQSWLKPLRLMPPVATYDQSSVSHLNETFVGELHSVYVDMLLSSADAGDNTVILGPTALTVVQSSMCDRFKRNKNKDHHFSQLRTVGTLDERLTVICDPFSPDNASALIGHISPVIEDRKVAMVQTGITNFEFGMRPDHADGWKAVGMRPDTLSWI